VFGTTRDSQRALISGATVSARNIDTGFARDTTTDGEGRYRLPSVPPGRYESTADANRLRSLFGLAPVAAFVNNPKYLNLNMTVQKSVRVLGRRARATMEAFNVLNTPQRLIGSAGVTSAVFGSYVAVVQPRTMQFTVQFDW
jgi:hypothetical protein